MKSVLIVDDDQTTIHGLMNHVPWGDMGITNILSAKDGLEALKIIREVAPDILITDIYMPRMDGLDLIKIVSEEFPYLHIIVHSGYEEFDNAREAMKYGVQHFFLKPSTISEICHVLRDILTKIEVQKKQQKLEKTFKNI